MSYPVGTWLKYAVVGLEPGDGNARFRVVEDRETRSLVTSLATCHLIGPPTMCIANDHLTPVEEPEALGLEQSYARVRAIQGTTR